MWWREDSKLVHNSDFQPVKYSNIKLKNVTVPMDFIPAATLPRWLKKKRRSFYFTLCKMLLKCVQSGHGKTSLQRRSADNLAAFAVFLSLAIRWRRKNTKAAVVFTFETVLFAYSCISLNIIGESRELASDKRTCGHINQIPSAATASVL